MAKKEKKPDPCSVLLKDVRLSFADIWEAKSMKDDDGKEGKPKFHANGLMEKDTAGTKANLALLKKAGDEAKKQKWGADASQWPKLKPEKVCVRDGDGEDWDGYENQWYVSASSDNQPLLVDRTNNDTAKKDGLLYAGARVNMRVRLWGQDNKFGKRLNAELQGVQFVNHDEPFGATPIAREDAFEDISEDGEVEPMGGGEEDGDSII